VADAKEMLDAATARQEAEKAETALAAVPRQPLLPKFLKAVAPFISRDETRAILTAVHLTPTHVAATDSYRLVRIGYKGGNANDFPKIGDQSPMTGIINAVAVDGKTFVKALSSVPAQRKNSRRGSLPVLTNVAVMDDGEHTVSLGVTDLDQSTVFVARKVQGSFPPYENLIPDSKENPPWAQVSVNASFLADMAKAVKTFGSDVVTIQVWSPLKPVMFTASNTEGGTFQGLQMPVRDGDKAMGPVCDMAGALNGLTEALKRPVGPGGYKTKRDQTKAIQSARDHLDSLLVGGAE